MDSTRGTLPGGSSMGWHGAAPPWRRRTFRNSGSMGRSDRDVVSRLGRLRAAAERCRHRRAVDAQHPRSTSPLRENGHNSIDALHALIEAKKLAYADMLQHVADPAFADVPVEAMLDKAYARARASLIDASNAQSRVTAGALSQAPAVLTSEGGDTTYLAVVDRHGSMVSLIQSNFASFGSGVVAEGTGFALQNRGALFTLDRAHPNVLAPRKRPLHTIIPAFMSSGARPARSRSLAGALLPAPLTALTAHRLRHHGRMESVAGARPVRVERCRSRHEHPGVARGGALHETVVRRTRRRGRAARARCGAARPPREATTSKFREISAASWAADKR